VHFPNRFQYWILVIILSAIGREDEGAYFASHPPAIVHDVDLDGMPPRNARRGPDPASPEGGLESRL
jgi:hypothetical protein